jgi:hypothetical protein
MVKVTSAVTLTVALLSAKNVNAFAPSSPPLLLPPSLMGNNNNNQHTALSYMYNSNASLNINAFSKPTQRSNTKLSAMPIDLDTITSLSSSLSSSSIATSLSPILSNENIKTAFNVATFGPQILWLFMIFLPNAQITKKLMGTYAPIAAFSLVHLFIVIASASQENGTAPLVEFNGVFDPSGDPQQAMMGMMKYPNFVSEEWSHVLTWDLFVGRIIWLDGLKRGVFTAHSVLFCNLIGPPGFLLHVATCLITGKGLVGNEAEDLEKDE